MLGDDGDGFMNFKQFVEVNTKGVESNEVSENLREAFSCVLHYLYLNHHDEVSAAYQDFPAATVCPSTSATHHPPYTLTITDVRKVV
ncbi:hypothetical protein V6N13_001483 [Hibiscus sabdariffa]|uniref:EF-hand domain-containing protein n=1 Tax=Hibiscus sabdariffa TaxID=183260 RepID=A0ABR2G8H3_9ROSI